MSAPVPHPGERLPSLDGLRGVAILLVLAHQLLVFDPEPGAALQRRVAALIDVGWVGVTLFFVLSGFLITHLLLGLPQLPGTLRAFYARRALRILPLCWLAVLVVFMLAPWFSQLPHASAIDHPVWYLLFISNWAEVFHVGGTWLPSFWSLAVEEQFYLLWPVLVMGRSPRQVFWMGVAAVVVGVGCRIALVALHAEPEGIYLNSLARVDALGLGACLAAALRSPELRERWIPRRRVLMVAAGLIFVAGILASGGLSRVSPLGQTIGYTAQASAFALWLAAALATDLGQRRDRLLGAGWLRSFGQYSYAIYIVHHPLQMALGPALQRTLAQAGLGGLPRALAAIVVGCGVLWCIGWLCWRLVERPLLALRPAYPGAR